MLLFLLVTVRLNRDYFILGLFGLHGTFDYYDIIATVISGVVTYFILHKVIDKIEIT